MKAFPNMTNQQGMDLRDYFAAKAMVHWLSLPISESQREIAAKSAYEMADAMMKAREQ
jgi:hypothetical protein